MAAKNSISVSDVYLWIDYACVDQDDKEVLMQGVNSLLLYAQLCDCLLSIDHDEYWERAWCRLEMLFALKSYRKQGFPHLQESFFDAPTRRMVVRTHRALEDGEAARLVEPESVQKGALSHAADRHMVIFCSQQARLL